jgi:hypothetical protein
MRTLFATLLGAAALSCAAPGLHAPVGISGNHRYFVDGNGSPIFWLGDTEWELFLSFRPEEVQGILDDRALKGFNAIQVMLLGVGGGKKANAAGEKPFLNDDPATPNEAYFANVESALRTAQALEIMLVIGVYHKSPESGTMITAKNARAYGTWVGRRFREAPNVIWSMYPEAKPAYLPVVRELAAGLREGDGGRHLLTVHPDPSPASSSFIHEEPWLSFNTLQTWKSDFLNYSMVAADYARTPPKPVLNGEARYEAEANTSPLQVRRGAYWSILAGGFYSFGHGGNWMKPGDWRRWLDSPGSQQMGILRRFFESLDWWRLVPDREILSGSSGEAVAARSPDRSWAVVYFPSPKAVDVKLDATNAQGSVDVRWMNPATGDTRTEGRRAARGVQSFTPPPGWEDAVLLLRAGP